MRLTILIAALAMTACTQAASHSSEDVEVGPASEARVAETSEGSRVGSEPEPETSAPVAASPVSEPLPAPSAPIAAPLPEPVAPQNDSRLVGVWVNENIMNSGGADFASFTTVMTMEIHSDGRILQYTESVGGGGDWSYGGGRSLDFDGRWRGDGRTLSVHGMGLPDFTPAATYSFSGDYLVTQSDMGRLIWQRRG